MRKQIERTEKDRFILMTGGGVMAEKWLSGDGH